ncbi:MAG: LVIVD repeat-containing protein [Actinomycetota bacterium]
MTLKDRESGRSEGGYRCNLQLVGQHQGEGASWQDAFYGQCAYYDTVFGGGEESPGVQVIDASNPAHPKLTATLTSPAMLGPWESLKVNEKRGLLAGVHGGSIMGVAFFDVYDVKDDCAHPKLLNSIPIPSNAVGHEGNWAPDGLTYYATGADIATLTAIDVSDPSMPRVVYAGTAGVLNHGLSVGDDGNRLYLATIVLADGSGESGLTILDVGQIQERDPAPEVTTISTLGWKDGNMAQHTIPIFYDGKPYLVFVDEGGSGAARIIDIRDEEHPRVVSKLKLQIHMPKYASLRSAETAGTGFFGYEGHYCSVDRQRDPTAVACGFFQSGIRVFDIRDPHQPREIAYFNPPAQTGKNAQLKGSEHANGTAAGSAGTNELTADWCSSQVRFYKDQLWTTCQDNGFMVLRFTNGVWPPA